MHCGEAFELLKPICNKVMKNPCKQNLLDLSEIFKKIPSKTLIQLQDYVLYPLQLNLQRPDIRKESKRYIVDCMKHLILCTEINNIKKFLNLFSLIFIQLFDKDSANMVANVSEELKLSVIQCATTITCKCTNSVVREIYDKSNIQKISQGIFMCVQIMQTEKLRSLRLAAIEFLMAITQVDGQDREIEVWRPDVADMIMYIVPGLLSGLHKVAIGDEKQGHLVTMMALRAWSRILVLVLEDIITYKRDLKVSFSAKVTEKGVNRGKTDTVNEKSKNIGPQSMLETIQNQHRTAEWAESVAENVTKMAESLRPLQQHPHWKVRSELAEVCCCILDKCQIHLTKASITLVEILLSLSDDETSEVSKKCEEVIKQVTKRLEEESGIGLYELLEENFYDLITKLPRIFHVESDRDKMSALSLLKQYLILLGNGRLPQLMQNSSHLQRTVLALLQAVELQSSGLSLLEDCSLQDLELKQDASLQTPWKQFKHFVDKGLSEKLEEVLILLGQNGDLEILCNHLLDLLGSDTDHRNEIVFILNEIMCGGACKDEYKHLVKNMLDMYLSPRMWYVPLAASATASQNRSPQKGNVTTGQARSNLQCVCLLLEGVGGVAMALGSHFQSFLMRCLYPVVERAGSPHEALAVAGLQAAAAMAKAVDQGLDITSILAANMDYFMVQVSIRLRNLHRDPGVLSVLCVSMRYSNEEMLPHMQNAVADVLLQSCDTFQMHHTTLFLHVFYTFFLCIKKWHPNKFNKRKMQSAGAPPKVSSVMDCFIEYIRDCQFSRHENIESAKDMDQENLSPNSREFSELEKENDKSEYFDGGQSDEKEEIPSHIQMTVSVLQRCLHLLPRKDKQCQLQALEALAEGVEVLSDYEDQLLPMVHQIWSPLVGRLQNTSDPLLLNRSFSLLCTLARLAQDFIRARTLKQVWPVLCRFLQDTAEKSKNKDTGSAFRYTQLFKLQLCLLQGLGELAVHLQLQEKEIYQLLNAAVPYLHNHQPKPLQESCVKLFQNVAVYDGDAVWLEMIKIKKQVTMQFKDNKEYIKNTKLILEYLMMHEQTQV